MLAAVIGLYTQGPGGSDGFLVTKPHRLVLDPTTAAAVPRLLLRLHRQGADVAGAHLAARRGHRGPPGDGGAPRRRARQGRHLRHAPLLPADVPRGLHVGHPGRHHARGHLGALRRPARHRPDRHHATDRLHLDQPLRLHRAGDLRHDVHRVRRVDALHGQPRLHHGRPVPHRRDDGQPAREQADRRLRGLAAGHPPARRVLPRGGAVRSRPARARGLRRRVPHPGGHLPALPGGRGHRHRRHHPCGPLHPAHLQADGDRAGARDRRRHARPRWPREVGHRAPHRPVPRPRVLPQARPRPHQPGGLDDAAPHGRQRPRTGRPGERPCEHPQGGTK